jgi:hypothetical protein
MSRNLLSPLLLLALPAALLAPGCRNSLESRDARQQAPVPQAPAAAVRPTVLDYVDSEAFDALFESALVNRDPAVLVRTGFAKPDWGGRLNAWIAAWNAGGSGQGRTVRGQAPFPGVPGVALNGETVREFRLLVNGLMDRVEELAKTTSSWWSEERVRSRRVALLRLYNLRFHRGEDGNILLVFFHGDHAGHYAGFIQALTSAADAPEQWSRAVECSECRRLARPSRGQAPARLTGLIAED